MVAKETKIEHKNRVQLFFTQWKSYERFMYMTVPFSHIVTRDCQSFVPVKSLLLARTAKVMFKHKILKYSHDFGCAS